MPKPSRLERHACGYWYVQPSPTLEELRAFYLDKYYPKQAADQKVLQYASDYDELELEHKRIAGHEALGVLDRQPGTMLEIGVGEGFFLEEFRRAGWASARAASSGPRKSVAVGPVAAGVALAAAAEGDTGETGAGRRPRINHAAVSPSNRTATASRKRR